MIPGSWVHSCNGDRHKHAHTPDYRARSLSRLKTIAQVIAVEGLDWDHGRLCPLLSKVTSDLSKMAAISLMIIAFRVLSQHARARF